MQLVILNVFSVLAYTYVLSIAVLKNERQIAWIVYLEIIIHSTVVTYYIGYDTGFHYYIFNLVFVPFYAYVSTNLIKFIRMSITILVSIGLYVLFYNVTPVIKLDNSLIEVIRLVNLISFLVIGTLVTYIFSIKIKDYTIELAMQSSTDSLTGLYNRRYFFKAAEIEVQAGIRNEHTTSILMLDIDFFKKVNDNYGHDCGDLVINTIAACITDSVRPNDIVARWGGEEYLILMPNTNAQELEIIAERIRQNIEDNSIPWKGNSINKTVSLGGAILDADEEMLDLIARADHALYLSKNNGRNCYHLSA